MTLRLDAITPCLSGIVPSLIATCSREGIPNVSYVSQLHFVDDKHVALSCQFFNKTRRNLEENPFVMAEVYDPVTLEAYHLELRYLRSETEGPLYDAMALRIQAIASHTGMVGVFRLLSADVCEVLSIERVDGFLMADEPEPPAPLSPPAREVTELVGLQIISQRINRARDLDELLSETLASLDELFGFQHAMVLLPDESGERLITLASRGYGESGVGAEVALGDGLIGTVAERRRLLRLSGVATDLRYGRAIRGRVEKTEGAALLPEIPLPGLCDAQSQLALPLLVRDRLVGVLAVESRDPLCFDEWHETFLEVVGNQIAMCVEHMTLQEESDEDVDLSRRAGRSAPAAGRKRTFCFYRNDDCVFVDDEYLIRNVPGKILWKILSASQAEGRFEFSNRELRLDPSLGLPPIKDNLESRLILLRKRLEQKCPDVRLVPVRRGRFALELKCEVELVEKDSA